MDTFFAAETQYEGSTGALGGGGAVPVYLSLTLFKGLTYRPDTDLSHTGDTEALTNGPCDCG